MAKRLSAIIIDDEEFARENLKMLLEEYCPDVELAGTAGGAREARSMVDDVNPDLVFLDIMMPGEDGFSFLESMPDRRFQVVFTTAFREHALRAIKESAIDYLEKPIDIEELQRAVAKAKEKILCLPIVWKRPSFLRKMDWLLFEIRKLFTSKPWKITP
jgi:two-component system LytT family response regulator